MGIVAKSYRFDTDVREEIAKLRMVYGTDNAAMRAVFGLSGEDANRRGRPLTIDPAPAGIAKAEIASRTREPRERAVTDEPQHTIHSGTHPTKGCGQCADLAEFYSRPRPARILLPGEEKKR